MKDPIRILLIDDDEDDYLITREIIDDITGRNYQLEWAPAYKEAMEKISQDVHDIYLVDYRLGAYDGLQLISESIARGIKAPFILLTGQGDTETDEKAMRVGATDYLVKGSFSTSELDRSIRYSMKHKKNLLQIYQLNQQLEERVKARTEELAQTVKKLEKANQNMQDQIRVRKIAEEALRESQYLYSTIAHNFPNGFISVFDRSLKYVFIDGVELRELGVETRDVIGKEATWFLEDTEKSEYMLMQLREVFEGVAKSFEMSFLDRDYVLYATPLPGTESDTCSQILVVTENITERKKAESEVRKALTKERELNELKSRFVTMASHEFRTPLSTILSSASLISRYADFEQQEKRVKHVERIKSNVQHLNRLLNDFLSLGKLEEGKTVNQPENIQLVNICRNIVEELQALAKPGQEIIFRLKGQPAEVYLDKQLLRNILINLLSNAIKYSPNGKNIKFILDYTAEYVTIAIADQGIGIPEQEQVHLFERFFRAKNTTNIQGTGLGLNIVKKYLDLMGGEISLESLMNQGTTVKVKFQLNDRQPDSPA